MLTESYTSAKKVVRRLRGGSQPILVQGEDGVSYVCKLKDNPQGTAVLFNEVVSARVARLLGVPVASSSIVRIDSSLSQDLYFETPTGRRTVAPGQHYGSRVVISPLEGRIYDCFPQSFRKQLRDNRLLTGGAILHLWLKNFDTTQAVYWRRCSEKKFSVTFIDNGHCLGGPDWRIASELDPAELAGLPVEHLKYWLKRLQQISTGDLNTVLSTTPEEWECNDKALHAGLLQWIHFRRTELIEALYSATEAQSTTVSFYAPRAFVSAPGCLA